VSSN